MSSGECSCRAVEGFRGTQRLYVEHCPYHLGLEKRVEELQAGLGEFCDVYGATHDDDCPEDDTCNCSGKPFNDRIEALFQGNSPYTERIASLETELTVKDAAIRNYRNVHDSLMERIKQLEARNAELSEEMATLTQNKKYAVNLSDDRLLRITRLEARNSELEKLYESACQRFDRLDKQV